jgi:hypothetical protein
MPDSQEILSALEGKGIKLGNYLDIQLSDVLH